MALSPTCTTSEREASEVALRKACSEAQILDFIDGLPFGFNTKVSERTLVSVHFNYIQIFSSFFVVDNRGPCAMPIRRKNAYRGK